MVRLTGVVSSRDDLPDHVTKNIGQPIFTTVVMVGQVCVIETEEMKKRGVNILGVHFVLLGTQPDGISRAQCLPPFDAPASQPHAEPVRIVITAIAAFAHRHAPEFATPDYES